MAAVEENINYEFDENVEDYNDDVDYEAEELEQDVVAHTSKKFKPDNSEKLLQSSVDASRNNVSIGESAVKEDGKDEDVYASLLETKYSDVKAKYEEAQNEIKALKRKRKSAPAPAVANPDERVKQLEDRVALIKTKAKERIAEKDSIIEEQNEKLKKFEEILALLEVNCKQAVVKYNDAQVELAKKEETLQQHLSFKNRYDYKVNFLDEKCRKQKNEYEIKIRKLEEKLGGGKAEDETEVASVEEQIKSDISDVKETDLVYPKKPKTLRIAKVEPKSGKVEPKKCRVEPKKAKVEPKSKLPKVVKGLTSLNNRYLKRLQKQLKMSLKS